MENVIRKLPVLSASDSGHMLHELPRVYKILAMFGFEGDSICVVYG